MNRIVDVNPQAQNVPTDTGAKTPTETYTPRAVICGFWRRIFAMLIDQTLFILLGYALGLILFTPLTLLGRWALLVGLCVQGTYSGILNSHIGGGQTIGKRIMHIAVTDSSGNLLSVGRSLLRFAVLFGPSYLVGFFAPAGFWGNFLATFMILGLSFTTAYLYTFNTRTRQALHDVITGTFVVNDMRKGRVVDTIWWPHLLISAAISIGLVVGGYAFTTWLQRSAPTPIAGLADAQASIYASRLVHSVVVTNGFWVGIGNIDTDPIGSHFVLVETVWKRPIEDYDKAARIIVSAIFQHCPAAVEMDSISVIMTYGFNTGLSSHWTTFKKEGHPTQWLELLGK